MNSTLRSWVKERCDSTLKIPDEYGTYNRSLITGSSRIKKCYVEPGSYNYYYTVSKCINTLKIINI